MVAVSLGDVVCPFQPYVEVEGEDELFGCGEALTLPEVVDVGVELGTDPSVLRDPREIIVVEDEVEKPLPAHAYSKVGKIPPGTYSRDAVKGSSGSSPLLKRPYLGLGVPRVGPKMDKNVASQVVESDVGRYAENAKGKTKRIKYRE